ncbi:MFS transporter [Paraburkholderia sp. USG1]|uniref:MFS transporter n=1 Tax=Paraburkholderia sp. USG1 TaxID=2952268 RepID=UPI002855D505|nr:MFS transporter [Paraburkholderia sp. USG1]MDR8396577.1 MFS transporter [Paraburkholderia sp. USG1]
MQKVQDLPRIESARGMVTLMVSHCAGMLDLVALPLWVGTLVAHYRFNPQQAGTLPTLFLIGASLSSMFFAAHFNRVNAKWTAVIGFAAAALAFALCFGQSTMAALAPLHFAGGLAVGAALSSTHGTIGRALNPHRVFAWAGLAIGIFGIVFFGATPEVLTKFGGATLFIVFAGTMGLAAVMGLLFFPRPSREIAEDRHRSSVRVQPLSWAVWYSIVGIALLAMTQAMTLSFYERIGMARGFGREMVTLALVIYGIVALVPAPLAGLLEKRIKATTVISIGPIMQAVCAMIVTHTWSYPMFAASGALMAFTILFTHTYAFGLLARLDATGRAVAATPAMLMVGAAIAPFLAGTLVKFIGFNAIGYAAIALVAIQLLLFNLTRRAVAQTGDIRAGLMKSVDELSAPAGDCREEVWPEEGRRSR